MRLNFLLSQRWSSPLPVRPRPSALLALLLLLGSLAGLTACVDSGTGPAAVKWDRVVCERCRMVLSARDYSAQIRGFNAEDKSTPHFFDDIGCALIWLDQQPWRDDPRTEIWVNDWRNGAWIDARTAYYFKGKETPMQYGLAAQSEPLPGALSFADAKIHILEVEARSNAPVFNPQAATAHPHPAE
jgi:copper chaperone NosL